MNCYVINVIQLNNYKNFIVKKCIIWFYEKEISFLRLCCSTTYKAYLCQVKYLSPLNITEKKKLSFL